MLAAFRELKRYVDNLPKPVPESLVDTAEDEEDTH
jgi:hypothetical protein